MEILENYPCDTNEQLLSRETHWIIELNASLNNCVKKSTKEYKKEWYNQHRELVREKQKQYRDAIKSLYEIDLTDLENNPQWFKNNVLNRRTI